MSTTKIGSNEIAWKSRQKRRTARTGKIADGAGFTLPSDAHGIRLLSHIPVRQRRQYYNTKLVGHMSSSGRDRVMKLFFASRTIDSCTVPATYDRAKHRLLPAATS